VIHTNLQSSLAGTNIQNTHNFNTAMVSQLASHRDKTKGSKKQSSSGVTKKEHTTSDSIGPKSTGGTVTKSSLNRNQGNNLKQTA